MLDAFSQRLGHTFGDMSLLEAALIHRSYTAERPDIPDNERMEFLGDAVLQLSVTQFLYEHFPDLREGEMAKVRAACVSGNQLADVASDLGLGPLVRMGIGEAASGGRKKRSILADAMEAVLAAVYLDAGFSVARDVVLGPLDADRRSESRRAWEAGLQDEVPGVARCGREATRL